MKVAVVVPNWNGAKIIEKCLDSLEKQTQKASIIVVDNGSVDNSLEIIEKKFPNVFVIKNKQNKGFAGGVNIGIKKAQQDGFDAVALLNNDAYADKDWLKKLVNTLGSDNSYGIVTGKLMRDDKKHFDSTGDNYSTRGIPFPRGRNVVDNNQYNKVEFVFGASGGASLYRIKMLNEIGLFDEKFFAYYEDVDISFRARLAGWEICYQPEAIAFHMVSATSNKLGNFAHYHSNKNFYFLYVKNMPAKLFWRYLHSFLYQALRSFGSSILHGKILSYLNAIWFVVINIPYMLRSRRRIQNNKKVSDSEIESYLHKGKPPISPRI